MIPNRHAFLRQHHGHRYLLNIVISCNIAPILKGRDRAIFTAAAPWCVAGYKNRPTSDCVPGRLS